MKTIDYQLPIVDYRLPTAHLYSFPVGLVLILWLFYVFNFQFLPLPDNDRSAWPLEK